ncbi:MAG: hypothetical protein KKA67_08745 [Spirochaetes bacterium]|nr:hypothetical protein [Spirochaetota bacterium]MBU1080420.1 hypothetical protein [Spirochaetota bacterium]
MEETMGILERSISSIGYPQRRLYLLATRKLLGAHSDPEFVASYATRLTELYASVRGPGDDFLEALNLCIEAYARACER